MGESIRKIDFIQIFLVISFFAVGLFHEFTACIAGFVLVAYLCRTVMQKKSLTIYVNLASISVFAIVVFYGISAFWALDSGSAVLGFFKFLPLLFFILILMQKKETPDDYLHIVPYAACGMTVLSFLLMQIPALQDWFSVSGRLSGFFQYANTFAIFLLAALIIVATKERHTKVDLVLIPILLFGIVASGSRTVFALMLLALFVLIITSKNKKYSFLLLAAIVLVVGAAAIYAAVTQNFSTIGRFLTTSLTESTFVGRLLYFRDALPVILRHPFGLGYMGYNYLQYSVQTGVYTVRFIHNDFLQLMLDIGWLPTALFVAAIIKAFFKKGASLRKRLLLFVIAAHTCFDFNFQYLAIFMLFLLLLDYKDGEAREIQVSKAVCGICAAVASALCLYMGLAQSLTYFKQYALSDRLYPWNTQNHIALLENANDDADSLADKIIQNNGYVALAYRVKAVNAFSAGDFEQVMEYQNEAIDVAPFFYETYEEYCYMLINGIFLYERAGDTYSAEVCREELLSVVEQLQSLPDKQSKLGKMIQDQPETELPSEIMEYVEAMENAE